MHHRATPGTLGRRVVWSFCGRMSVNSGSTRVRLSELWISNRRFRSKTDCNRSAHSAAQFLSLSLTTATVQPSITGSRRASIAKGLRVYQQTTLVASAPLRFASC